MAAGSSPPFDGRPHRAHIDIETPHGTVPCSLETPERALVDGLAVLLAHGAGAGQQHPWMVGMTARLIARGLPTMTFDYAYVAAGRKAPDRLPKLLDVHEAVAVWLAEVFPDVVLAGKSMGGRVGGHLVADGRFPAVGLAYLGYPLVALGATGPRSTTHIETIDEPQLFVSGDRDRLGPIDLVAEVSASVPHGTLVVIEGGDHSFTPLKSSGRTIEDSLDLAANALADWTTVVMASG